MSEDDEINPVNKSVCVIFHGTAKEYFKIFIVNFLLTTITCGIYGAWALVRTKRYFYANTEISGSRFSYHASGGSIFFSWLCLIALYIGWIMAARAQSNVTLGCMLAVFILFFPYVVMHGLRFQAMMTELNGVRFNFKCAGLKGWWVILGCPLLMLLVLMFIIVCSYFLLRDSAYVVGISVTLYIIGISIIRGIVYYLQVKLLYNNVSFGKHYFSTNICVMKCLQISSVSMLILLPFLLLCIKIITPLFHQLASGEISTQAEDISDLISQIAMCYGLFILGILVSSIYSMVALRKYVFSSTTLQDRVSFRSTLTFTGCLWQTLSNLLISVCTCWLAYPWAKVRYARYVAKNTWIDGDLEALDLQDHDEQPEGSIISRISRGLML
ncbi:YjgN family protein [Hafnia paralvei]|nr:DUF898 family protein [Hafnia paralvei]EFV40644.1 hypothetical protein HMPREF0864_01753 [Enterobacteriaceae bacterium 9_2_54FAA]KHS45702.1 hypothetical protein RN38_12315 [Hafnia paralvei]